MGNSAGAAPAASGPGAPQTPADLAKVYLREDQSERVDHWEVSAGSRKRDGLAVSCFRHAKTGGVNDEMASNALRMARRIRHPLLLAFLDGAESEQEVVIVTEAVTPLATWLRANPKPTPGAVEWGLRCLASALVFLNEEAQLIHGNVQTSSVFVTGGGDWKFAGMEVFGETKGEPSPMLRQAQWIPDAYYKSPERRANDWTVMSRSPAWALDVFGMACIWSDVFAGPSSGRSDPNSVNAQLPPPLRDVARQLLSPSPEQRPRPSQVIKNEYFSHIFVRSSLFMEELQLKPAEKREPFFKSLVDRAASFPKGTLQYKFSPLIVQAVAFETREVNTHNAQAAASGGVLQPKTNALVPMLEAILAIDACVRPAATQGETPSPFEPAVVDLFSCNDRSVRITLLQRMDRIASMLSSDTLNGPLFDAALTGFADAAPMVRELTIKAIVPLIGKLNETNKNDKLMRCFAKLQSDDQAAIRTNTIVCLSLVSSHLSADTRRKVLPASFARAMKDPFVHARVAGLRGLTQTHRLLALDTSTLAVKIMPSVCPLLADPAKEVRAAATDCMQALLTTLAVMAEQAETAAPAADGAPLALAHSAPQASADAGLLMRGLGWAAESLTARIASAPAVPEPRLAAPQPSSATAPPPPQAQPLRAQVSWEEDDEDDFAALAPSKPKAAPPSGKPVSMIGRAKPAPAGKDLLGMDAWGAAPEPPSAPPSFPVYSGTKLVSSSSAPSPKQPSPRAAASGAASDAASSATPPSMSGTAADDFFNTLLTAPPPKKAASGASGPPPAQRVRRQPARNPP